MTNLQLLDLIAAKMFYAVVCGSVVGLERKIHKAPAGFKTQILVCVGSMLFTVIGGLISPQGSTDVARVVGQIITGVGFLGAGAIIHGKEHSQVVGLTTAAWIWFISAIGILIGLEYGPTATFTTVSLVCVVTAARKIERAYFYQQKDKDNITELRPKKNKEAA